MSASSALYFVVDHFLAISLNEFDGNGLGRRLGEQGLLKRQAGTTGMSYLNKTRLCL